MEENYSEVEKTLIIILFYINMWLLNIYIAKLIKWYILTITSIFPKYSLYIQVGHKNGFVFCSGCSSQRENMGNRNQA